MVDEVDLELRFERGAQDSVAKGVEALRGFDVTVDKARDPIIAAVISVTAASISLAIELIKLRRELKSSGEKGKVWIVKLGSDGKERQINLLEEDEQKVNEFISDKSA